jgi:hypothetical protein
MKQPNEVYLQAKMGTHTEQLLWLRSAPLMSIGTS